MKTPPDPDAKDLVVAAGRSSRRKRGETDLIARAELACNQPQSLSTCSGTETLAMIERALYRLADGTFGKCVSCGSEISLSRLDQNPAIETCVTCHAPAQFKSH